MSAISPLFCPPSHRPRQTTRARRLGFLNRPMAQMALMAVTAACFAAIGGRPAMAQVAPSAAAPPVAAATPAAPPARSGEEINRIVLRVNDRIVTLFDYHERLRQRQQQIVRADIPEGEKESALAAAPAEALRELMDEALLMSRGDQLSATVDEDRLDRAEQSAKRNFGITSEADFAEALRQSGMTREQFRKHRSAIRCSTTTSSGAR